MIKHTFRRLSLSLLLLSALSLAKDAPQQVIDWPPTGKPVLRFTFSKFKEIGALGSQRSYVADTTAQNL